MCVSTWAGFFLLYILRQMGHNGGNIACIILAAGESTRCGGGTSPKQFTSMAELSDMTPVEACIKTVKEVGIFKQIILVTRSAITCDGTLTPVVANTKTRMDSIKAGIGALVADIERVIIHDAARPFVPCVYFTTLCSMLPEVVYAQYYMPIIGGLLRSPKGGEAVFCDPAEYKEVATPLMIKTDIAQDVIKQHEARGETLYEFYPFLSEEQKRTQCLWIFGEPAKLRKITYLTDIL